MRKLLIICSLFLIFSCQKKITSNATLEYFDTPEFVQKEISDILKQEFKVTKTINLNGEIETLTKENIDSAFLLKEFQQIIKANINKPAFLGFYAKDSIWIINAERLEDELAILYSCDEDNSKLKTKKIIVSDDNEYLFVLLENQNFLHAYSKELRYSKNKYLELKAWEKTVFQDTLFYETKLEFLK